MEIVKKERPTKKGFVANRWSIKLFSTCILATALLISFGFMETGNIEYKRKRIDSVRFQINAPYEIEVMTSQQLFVFDVSNQKKGSVNFKAKLKDAIRAVRYNLDSTICDTGWLLASLHGKFSAGLYNKGQTGYSELDSLISKINAARLKGK